MSRTFNLPESSPPVRVTLPEDLSPDRLLAFPAFKIWNSTLQHSLSLQRSPSHPFFRAPYSLRSITVQAVDYFGGQRLGFVKLKAEVKNEEGEHFPGSVFLRGGSVAMMLILQPDDAPEGSEKDKHVLLALQPRIPAGSLSFPELPAGMIDDSGTFAGAAAKEIAEETGLKVPDSELINLTELAIPKSANEDQEENLQRAMYPSPGGSDEFIPLFLWQKRVPRGQLQEWEGKLTGLREYGEKITLRIVRLEELWREGARDGKTLAAWALYEGLRREGKL